MFMAAPPADEPPPTVSWLPTKLTAGEVSFGKLYSVWLRGYSCAQGVLMES